MVDQCLYIFLDEGGNLDFTPQGTTYFTLTGLSVFRPFDPLTELVEYRYECIEWGLDQEYFHCCEDNRHVRKRVFEIISRHIEQIKVDALIVEKRKAHSKVRNEMRFYPEMLGQLLKWIINREDGDHIKEVIVITDQIPLNKKRKAIKKAVKMTLSNMLPDNCKYRILHHVSKAHVMLQCVDYLNWAIFRKWERDDPEYYDMIKVALKSEFDIFQLGTVYFY